MYIRWHGIVKPNLDLMVTRTYVYSRSCQMCQSSVNSNFLERFSRNTTGTLLRPLARIFRSYNSFLIISTQTVMPWTSWSSLLSWLAETLRFLVARRTSVRYPLCCFCLIFPSHLSFLKTLAFMGKPTKGIFWFVTFSNLDSISIILNY